MPDGLVGSTPREDQAFAADFHVSDVLNGKRCKLQTAFFLSYTWQGFLLEDAVEESGILLIRMKSMRISLGYEDSSRAV